MPKGNRVHVNVASVFNAIDDMLGSLADNKRAQDRDDAKMLDQTAEDYRYHRARVRRMLQGMLGSRRYVVVDFSGMKW